MQRSYSHKGYPYDNACIESFHSLIKRKWLNRFNIKNYRHAYNLIFEYIELHNQMIYIRNFFIKSSISKDSKKVLGVIELIKNIEEQEQKFLLSILQKLR